MRMTEPRYVLTDVSKVHIGDVQRNIIEELNEQFLNTIITPNALGSIRDVIYRMVASHGDASALSVDIRVDEQHPTQVNITPLNLYTGLVIHGIFDYTSDQVRFLQTVENIEVLEAGGVCRIDSIVTERGTFKLLVSSDAEILPVFCIEPIKPVTYIDVKFELPQSPH